jgi:DNA topoisomerase IB
MRAEVEADGTGLVRSDLSAPGFRRVRCGRGFRYLDSASRRPDDATVDRIKRLVIPPAWQDVWICADPNGHLHATGVDSAGRTQYLYHPQWRQHRDAAKHDRMLEFGSVLPEVRRRVAGDLRQRGLTRERVLAAAIRLVDLGFFRAGGEEYAEENGTFGLATIQRGHVRLSQGQIIFEYTAKGDKAREQAVADDAVRKVIASLKRRKGEGRLLCYWSGHAWHDVTAADLNAYLREISGADITLKDFRTWHATVLAAVGLAVSEHAAPSEAARKRAVTRVVKEVAGYLGNTPAVARRSYIDPRLISRYNDGVTMARVLSRLGEHREFGELATRGCGEEAVLGILAELRKHPPATDEP